LFILTLHSILFHCLKGTFLLLGKNIYIYIIKTIMLVEFTNANADSGRLQTKMVMYDLPLILKVCVCQWDITVLRSYFWFLVLTLCLTKTGSSHYPFSFYCVQGNV